MTADEARAYIADHSEAGHRCIIWTTDDQPGHPHYTSLYVALDQDVIRVASMLRDSAARRMTDDEWSEFNSRIRSIGRS